MSVRTLARVAYSTASSTCEKVGFVGLGNMGRNMAANLLKRGFDIVAYDRNEQALAGMDTEGGSEVRFASSPADLVRTPGLTAVFTMLPSSAHVREVYTGPEGFLSAAASDIAPTLFVDCSTTGPECAEELAGLVEGGACGAGATFVDAPVSGGVPGASAATLTFMVGARTPAAFERAKVKLSVMGKNVTHCGDVGAGQSTKLCNNLVLGISMAAVAESIALGQSLGLCPKMLSDVFNTSSARCWSSDTYNPCPGVMAAVPSAREYDGGFATDLMCKDLRMARDASEGKAGGGAHGGGLRLGREALGLYEAMQADGRGAKDFSSIYRYIYKGKE